MSAGSVVHRALTTRRERMAFGLPPVGSGLTILCGNNRFVSASSDAHNVTCKGCRRKMEA